MPTPKSLPKQSHAKASQIKSKNTVDKSIKNERDSQASIAAAKLEAAMDIQFGHLFEDSPIAKDFINDVDETRNIQMSTEQENMELSDYKSLLGSKLVVEDLRSDEEFEDDCDFPSDDESMTSTNVDSDESINHKPTSTADDVAVVVFDDSNSGRSSFSKNKSEWRAFMSSKIHKVAGRSLSGAKPSSKQLTQEKEDEENDRKLYDLLKTSKLVEQYTSSELTGKDRVNYQRAKMVELGGKAPKPPKVPLPIRISMAKKSEERARQKIQEAKDSGMYHHTLKTQITGGNTTKNSKKSRFGKRADAGIVGSIGRIKDGVMHVAKKHIRAVEGTSSHMGGANKKRKFNGDSSIMGLASRGNGGKKKTKMVKLGI
ncbi:hypothetical protein BDV3_002128 [Batrachochytrium dendrobatidis]